MFSLETLTAIHTLASYAGKPGFGAVRSHSAIGLNIKAWPFETPPKVGNMLSGPNALTWDLMNSDYI